MLIQKGDVTAELAWHPAVKSTAIGVAVKNGVVLLSGHLETSAEKHAADRALRRVVGVQAVALELDMGLSFDHKRSDTDIADLTRKNQEALTRQALREAKHIQVDNDGTTVKLNGTVHSWHEHDALQGVAWAAPAVHAVVNQLRVG